MVDRAFRQAALQLAVDAPVQDIIDLADLAFARGDEDGALLLFGAAALETGTSGDNRRWQADVASRTGLWSSPSPGAAASGLPMLEKAAAELRVLLRSVTPAIAHDPVSVMDAHGLNLPEISAEAVVTLTDTLVPHVRAMLEHGDEASIEAIVAPLIETVTRWTVPLTGRHASADPATLARLAVLARLGGFARRTLEWRVITGNASTAPILSLAPDGLGPIFANVPRLLPDVRDLPALLRLAGDAALAPAEEAGWLIVLTINARPTSANDLALLLAQRAGPEVLRHLIGRGYLSRRREWFWAARDASLAFGNAEIAIRAQRALTDLTPSDRGEWIILGDLLGLSGHAADAENAFAECAALQPGRDVAERRIALHTERFSTVAMSTGFFAEPFRRPWASALLAGKRV